MVIAGKIKTLLRSLPFEQRVAVIAYVLSDMSMPYLSHQVLHAAEEMKRDAKKD
jgi:hypothetical protein